MPILDRSPTLNILLILTSSMPQILISVRNALEVDSIPESVHLGIVDVKEPRSGPLGRADLTTISDVIEAVRNRWPVSAAFGELRELEDLELQKIPPIEFAKVGLSQMNSERWKSRWERFVSQLPTTCHAVAVIYADGSDCGAPDPTEVIDFGAQIGCRAVLIDTYDKTQGTTFERMKPAELVDLRAQAREHSLKFVLAGGIRSANDIERACQLDPDWIGVRGAVCGPDRTQSICPARVIAFSDSVGAHRRL